MSTLQILSSALTFCLFITAGYLLIRYPHKFNPVLWRCFGINREKIIENRRSNVYYQKQMKIVGYAMIIGTILGSIVYILFW